MALSRLIYELYSHQWIQADQKKTIGVNGDKIKVLFCSVIVIVEQLVHQSIHCQHFYLRLLENIRIVIWLPRTTSLDKQDGFLRCDDEHSYLAKNASDSGANGSLSISRLSFIDSRLVPLTPSIDLWLLAPKCIRIPSNSFFDLPSCLSSLDKSNSITKFPVDGARGDGDLLKVGKCGADTGTLTNKCVLLF
ncbi:uncharacterized protein MELLADRAFT_108851 [Melampsora larici-populina 98AG31]|uniref:Uncharacterized protein n=1 Tax=Melampsora larici-populina (strain 98AG31 / pathotype 3-4-7) TaxID=747676 RepID=F4RUH3_MELLP|nr:uncharacterized protein MELLADRAFT_108851 [Melampsora larici-populina 98AG31]EGG03934.1 hypothetical protein MELLADRAFT_108851 [Melampsora larici-populina 98AG31]